MMSPTVKAELRRPPNDYEVARGAEYVFSISAEVDDSGAIYQLWYDQPFCRYESQPKRPTYSVRNLLGKPALVFRNRQEEEILRIVRAGRLPPKFAMVITEDGTRQVVGTIRLVTPLRNKYLIELSGANLWAPVRLTFHMPLFTIYFHGGTMDGKRLWVKVWETKRQWLVLRPPELNHPYLLPALAFVHREWWCFG